MGTVTLLLGIHNHQPEGNFEHVFAQGYEDCYRRLLEAIARHPAVRWTLHYSGPLIEWLERHHPDYFDQIADLTRRGQLEMMGGGFYEPMLSVLPERDAQGQLAMMAEFLEGRVGQRPRGMWLAERVWEPDLARVIASAGYRYTIVDDGHFLAAGMRRPLRGYYVTDKAGLPLCLFPISMELRYALPFKPAQECIDLLRRLADEAGEGDVVLTYGDDGEKFGMWPGTRKWVWDEGWLEQFLSLLEKSDCVRTATFSEVLQRDPPEGRVYLPTASYDEMGEWSLPAEAQARFHALSRQVGELGHRDDWGPFVRGGIWQGFMAKYPEANFMHKRMCFVSERVARARAQLGERAEPELQRAQDAAVRELYRGQCNCAYWHGLFGGLYLAKLRAAVHSHLIQADVEAGKVLGVPQPITLERADLDADLSDEVILTGRRLGIIVSAARGGSLLAIDDRKRAFCVTDVLSRRPEAYHEKVRELSRGGHKDEGDSAPKSIHEITHLKDEGLADLLVYDPHQRLAFVDHFFPADVAPEQIWRCRARELGDFASSPYELLASAGGAGRLSLSREGHVCAPGGEVAVTLQKEVQLGDERLRVAYEISPLPAGTLFATELSLALPCGPHASGRCRVSTPREALEEAVTATGATSEVCRVELHDPHSGMTIALILSPAATLVRFPLETVSQSESGIERTYQGTVLALLWAPPADGGRFRPEVQLEVH
jgi:4-alpha-glucanotransferase